MNSAELLRTLPKSEVLLICGAKLLICCLLSRESSLLVEVEATEGVVRSFSGEESPPLPPPLVKTLEEPSSEIEMVVAFRFGAAAAADLLATADEFSLMEALLLVVGVAAAAAAPTSAFPSFWP